MPRPDPPKVDHPYVFSVSQIETFRTCPRKWAFEKIDNLPSVTNKYAQLGTEVHDALEEYLAKGVPLDRNTKVGKIAFPGIRHLPVPLTPGMRVEKWFVFKFGVAAYRGLKDVELFTGSDIPLVLDHKTTRNFIWKKKEKELITDVQAGVYSAEAMVKYSADRVRCKWVYYKTEGAPKSEPVTAIITKSQASKVLGGVDDTAKEMIKVFQTCDRAMDVSPDYTGCYKYGGCPRLETHCKPKASNILEGIMAKGMAAENRKDRTTSDFMKEMKNRRDKNSSGRKIDIDSTESVPVNSSDRDEAEQPPPPNAKKINGEWVQPQWDKVEFEWVFPEEEKPKKKKKASKITQEEEEEEEVVVEEEEEEEKPKKKKSKFDLKEKKKKNKSVEKIDDEEEEEEEEPAPKKKKEGVVKRETHLVLTEKQEKVLNEVPVAFLVAEIIRRTTVPF